MAENNTLTQTTVLQVDTLKAVKSVQDLRDNIKTLRQVMNEATIGTDEYVAAQEELAAQQNALREIQRGSAASIEEVSKAAAGLGTSYAALVNQMAKLRAEYRTTEDEAKRARLANEIKDINDKLKDMDATRGVFSRNVGDYANQMSKAFSGVGQLLTPVGDGLQSIGIAAGGMIGPIGGVNTAMKALNANPIFATVTVIVGVLAAIIRELKSNEEAMNRVKVALAPLNAASNVFTKIMQSLGKAIASAVEWLGKMADKLGLVSDEAKEHQRIMQEEIEIQKQQRRVAEANSESEMKISELKAKAAEKDKYTAQERLEFLRQASDEEKAISKRNLDLAQREYDMLKAKSELAENSKEENDALSQAYIKLNQQTTAYNNKLRELNAQMAEATNQMNAQAKAAADAAEKIRALADLSLDIDVSGLDAVEEINEKIILPEDQWTKRAKLMQENIDREADMQVKKNMLLIEDEQTRADEEWRIRMEAEERKLAVIREAEENTTDPFAKLELQRQIADMEVDIEVQKEEYITEKAKEEADRRKALFIASLQGMSDIAAGTADLLNTIADNMEVTNEKEFKRQQKLQIASATINMLSGVAAAVASAMTLGPIMGPIMGAINSATVIATGVAQINKIKQQKYGSTSSAAPSAPAESASVPPPNIETQLPTVRTLTGAKEEERLNRMASPVRAYIVDSDLQAKQRERDVIDKETSF